MISDYAGCNWKNYWQNLSRYDKVVQLVESGQAKKHVFCSEGTVAGMGCETLACVLAIWATETHALQLTARWYGELPSVSGLACVFAKSR